MMAASVTARIGGAAHALPLQGADGTALRRVRSVLVDTPPILAVTDAAIIGQQAGTSLIVAHYGMNSAKEVDVSVHRFEQNKVEIKGAILNAIERRASN